MTVTQLLERLAGAFPAFNARAVEAWAPVFRAQFGKREGPHLADAFTACLASFDPKAKGKLFPTPPDIEAHMPRLGQKSEGSPKLDMPAHSERKKQLLEEWRHAQGFRGANGVSQVMQALEFIADPIAHERAWRPNPEEIRLSRAQLVLAQHRALSLERRTRHGLPPKSADEWWTQISAIAEQWGIITTLDQWSRSTTTAKEAA